LATSIPLVDAASNQLTIAPAGSLILLGRKDVSKMLLEVATSAERDNSLDTCGECVRALSMTLLAIGDLLRVESFNTTPASSHLNRDKLRADAFVFIGQVVDEELWLAILYLAATPGATPTELLQQG
jgi:hypothetical protein